MCGAGHKIQWDETTSIDHDGDWFRMRVKEALYIRSSNAMNWVLEPWSVTETMLDSPRTDPLTMTGTDVAMTTIQFTVIKFNFLI